MQFSFPLWPGNEQLFEFLIKTIEPHDVIISKTSKATTAHGYLFYAHSKQIPSTQNNPNAKKAPKPSTL